MKILLLLMVLITGDLQVLHCQTPSRSHVDTARKTAKTPLTPVQNITSVQNIKREQPDKLPAMSQSENTQILISSLQILATLMIAYAVYRQTNKLSIANREQVENLNKANREQADKLNEFNSRQADKLKRVELQGQAIQAYNHLNQVAVSSIENLIALDSIGREDIIEPIEVRRKRWCAFIWLEALQVTFYGKDNEMIEEDYAEQTLRQQLQIILKDDFVYKLVCERGFGPRFVMYCSNIKAELSKANEAKVNATKNGII